MQYLGHPCPIDVIRRFGRKCQIGAELRITDRLFLLARFDTGFDYYSQSSRPANETYLRARIGLGWAR